jgi:hypothetical protein
MNTEPIVIPGRLAFDGDGDVWGYYPQGKWACLSTSYPVAAVETDEMLRQMYEPITFYERENEVTGDKQRTAIVDLYRAGWKYDAISRVLGISNAQCRTVLVGSPQAVGEQLDRGLAYAR